MSFRARLLLCAVLPTTLFVIALGVSLWGLARTQSEFDRYIGTEQATANGLTEMYAQGLQMGQALRNIVLDPANKKAYDNFTAAEAAYRQAQSEVSKLATGNDLGAVMRDLGRLRELQASQQEQILRS